MIRNLPRGALWRRAISHLLCAALLALVPPVAKAARPLLTDDAATVAPGALELSIWCERVGDERLCPISAAFTSFGSTELTLAAGRFDGESSGDLASLGAKRVLIDGGEESASVALSGAWNRFGPRGAARLRELDLIAVVTVPTRRDGSVVHVNLGARDTRGAGRRTQRALWAIAFDHESAHRVGFAAEVFGTGGEERRWQSSLRWQPIPERLQLDAGYRRALGRAGDPLTTVGLVVFFGP